MTIVLSLLRILIADDHDLVRRGIKSFLESHAGWTVCGEAQTGVEAVEKARELSPDIAILDITMPELNGIDAARKIQKESPQTKTLIVSMHYSENIVREVLAAGIRGYVVKSDSVRDLGAAIEAVANGKTFFTSLATKEMLTDLRARCSNSPEAEPIDDRLTSREREILQLLSEGKIAKEVAAVLNISVKTVETHRSNMMRKLEIHNAADLVRYAVRNRIIEP
jgi:DNA-binding NarL/FixJ family response regulator